VPLYAAMDAAYGAAAAAYRFACTGCEESCCRTRFHHHTLVEYHGLRDGFERLPAGPQAEILARAESWCAEHARPRSDARPLCPLNSGGRCVLYAHRPMICRLHGIPHELRRPGQPEQRSPGCGEFNRRCGRMAYHPFDRTPLYTELARLESEFQQALGVHRRFKHTIAEMLLSDRLAP
jgi:Fe-S-cluster containining protein